VGIVDNPAYRVYRDIMGEEKTYPGIERNRPGIASSPSREPSPRVAPLDPSQPPEMSVGVSPDDTPPSPAVEHLPSRPYFFDLTPAKAEELFAEYYENPNILALAKKHRIPYKTLLRVSTQKDWEGRREKLIAKAEAKTDYNLERATEQSLLMVRAAKNKLASRLSEVNYKHIDADKIFSEIERMIRLEQLLLGGTESRKETVAQTHEERMKELREQRMLAAKNVTPHGDGDGRPN
jgi:hypothetical protein